MVCISNNVCKKIPSDKVNFDIWINFDIGLNKYQGI